MVTAAPAISQAACSSAPHVQRRVAWLSILGFWLLYFFLNTLRMALQGEAHQVDMLGRRAVVAIFGIALTAAFEYLLRRIDNKRVGTLVTAAFLGAVPVSVAYATVNYTVFEVLAPLEPPPMEAQHPMTAMKTESSLVEIASATSVWYFFIASWAVLYVALAYAAKVAYVERTAASYRAEAQTAQLRALRYQINPHFLFNTLNSLSALVMSQRGDDAERMILNLSNFFRTSLTADSTEDVSLADEIRMQRLYLDIELIRFPDRLQLVFDVPPDLDGAMVPALILQPIVENAIKHGVAPSARPVTITVSARADQGRLRLHVHDDADMAPAQSVPQPGQTTAGHGVGLRNVRDRLNARFPGAADCVYGPRPTGGFAVDLDMPLVLHG